MVRLDLLRTATLLPHALIVPTALVATLVLSFVLGFLVFKGLPEEIYEAPVSPIPTPSPTASPGVTLKEVFDYRLKDYKSKLDGLDANVKLQAVFVVFTVLLILRRSDSLNIFGNHLPLQWLHLFVPLVLLYLWLNFGFLLHGLIEDRFQGVRLLEKVGSSTGDLGKTLFRDSGFVDGWFLSFVDRPSPQTGIGDYSGIDHNSRASTSGFLLLILGTLLSAAHACLLAIAFIGCRRYLRQSSRRFLLAYYALPLLPLALMIASHIQFAYGGSNRNFIQLYIAFMTIPLTAVLLWISVRVDMVVDPASVQCLMRQRRLTDAGSSGWTTRPADSVEVYRTISLIGDSLSTGFYVGSLPGMFMRMWRSWRGSWFVSVPDDGTEVRSVFERLHHVAPISAVIHATPRATVDEGGRRSLVDLLTNNWHFSHQVDEVLIGEFPDLLLIWIGHNNIDWRYRVENLTKESCEAQAAEFAENYERQLRRLVKGAVRSKKPVVIIVYGLINFESFFRARGEAERLRKGDPTQFPYLEKGLVYFDSMRLKHQPGMSQLAGLCNERMGRMCGELRKEIEESGVRLVYSDALSRAEIPKADMLNQFDAWHPSPAGHRLLAESAYATIEGQLEYLGWEPES